MIGLIWVVAAIVICVILLLLIKALKGHAGK